MAAHAAPRPGPRPRQRRRPRPAHRGRRVRLAGRTRLLDRRHPPDRHRHPRRRHPRPGHRRPPCPAATSATTVTCPISAEHDKAAVFVMLYGRADEPLDWLRAGEALSAGWLTATELGVSVLPHSAPIEVARHPPGDAGACSPASATRTWCCASARSTRPTPDRRTPPACPPTRSSKEPDPWCRRSYQRTSSRPPRVPAPPPRCHRQTVSVQGDRAQAARRYWLMTPPRSRVRRSGASSATRTLRSWSRFACPHP